MNEENIENKIDLPGLPFKTQLLGGFCKKDVISYLEKLISSMEEEKKELEKEKNKYFELMKKGQTFSDNAIVAAREQAAGIVKDARKEADELIQDAKKEISTLRGERADLMVQCQSDADNLINFMIEGYKEIGRSYEQILKPLMEFSRTLKGRSK